MHRMRLEMPAELSRTNKDFPFYPVTVQPDWLGSGLGDWQNTLLGVSRWLTEA